MNQTNKSVNIDVNICNSSRNITKSENCKTKPNAVDSNGVNAVQGNNVENNCNVHAMSASVYKVDTYVDSNISGDKVDMKKCTVTEQNVENNKSAKAPEIIETSITEGQILVNPSVTDDETTDVLSDPILYKDESILNDSLSVTPQYVWDMVKLCNEVMKRGYPNAWGARIPLKLRWNLTLMESLLNNYEDKEVIEWLKYGWPISRPPNWPDPVPTFNNHASADNHPECLQAYVHKELERSAIAGPVSCIPFTERLGVSPLSTREKRDSPDRRILMDLSWPPDLSVNDGIAKDQFMGFNAKLTFPTVDSIAKRIVELENQGNIMLFKVDLSAYFRQIPLDPGDYSLLCFTWNKELYFDLVSPQGL